MELTSVLIWLVVLVLALQVAEFGLRLIRALARRVNRSQEPDQRERFLDMSPLEKIETFRLDQLDDQAQQLFLAAVNLPAEERRRITSLLRLGWNGRSHPTPAPALVPAHASNPPSETPDETPTAAVLSLPIKSVQPKGGPHGMAGSERR